MSSFEHSPQMELYKTFHDLKPIGDLDILCLSNGELIVGEAKHSSDLFAKDGRKSLNSLIEAVKAIKPDHVVLSCSVDVSGKLQKEVSYVVNGLKGMTRMPKVEGIVLNEPEYDGFTSSMYFPI